MDLTMHGADHVWDRTQMRSRDVLTLLENDVYIHLGYAGGVEYKFFYSPEDRDGRVALVSNPGSRLVSIWLPSFRFPAEITRPTQLHRDAARMMVSAFLRKRISSNSAHKKRLEETERSVIQHKQQTREKTEYRVLFTVHANKQRIAERQLGTVDVIPSKSAGMIQKFSPQIQKILDVRAVRFLRERPDPYFDVGLHKMRPKQKIGYCLVLNERGSKKPCRKFTLDESLLLKHLKPQK